MPVVILVESLGDIRNRAGDHAGFVFIGGVPDHVREAADQPEQRLRLIIGQSGPVRRRGGEIPCLPQNGTAAGVGILDIGAAFPVKVQRRIPSEIDILDTVIAQIGINDRADTDLPGDGLLILQIRGFFPDNLQGLIHRL